MDFETVQFFEYNIRSTVIDNVRMYLVADLLNQYNKKNGKKRRFLKYLQNQQTLDLLLSKQKDTGEPNSVLQCQPCTKHSKWDIDYKYNDELDAILDLTDFKIGCGY